MPLLVHPEGLGHCAVEVQSLLGRLLNMCHSVGSQSVRICAASETCLPCAAQSWGSEESIQRLPLQQQAYMTAALSHSLELLGKEQLEATPGLFPALLSGVSARLDSPEGPIRQEQSFTHCLRVHAALSMQPCQCRSLIHLYRLCNMPSMQCSQ